MSKAENTKGERQELSKELTTLDGWAVGTGAMMGVTIFVVSGQISGVAGPAACLGFLIASVVVMIVALCYCEVATAFPVAGGAYMFPKLAIGGEAGNFLGFISGWGLWGGQGLGAAIVSMTCANYISWMIELMGGRNPIPNTILGYILIIFFGVINMRSTGGGRAVQLLSTFIITAIMLIFIIWGAPNTKSELLTPFAPNGMSTIWTCAAVCMLSYGGWSTIPAMSEEFKNPAKQVPRSIIYALATCGIIFTVFVYVMNGLMPGAELAVSSAPPADAFTTITKYGALLIAFGGVFACVSTANGMLMTGARVPFSMSRSGALPAALHKINKNGAPYVAIIFTVIGQLLLAFTGLINLIAQMIVFVTAVCWLISMVCLYFLRKKNIKAPFRAPCYPVILVLSFIALIFMMSRLARAAIIIGTCWIIFGIAVYFLFNKTGLKKFCVNTEAAKKAAKLGESV